MMRNIKVGKRTLYQVRQWMCTVEWPMPIG